MGGRAAEPPAFARDPIEPNAFRAIRVGHRLSLCRTGLSTIEAVLEKRARRAGHHGGNFTKSRILPLIGVATNAPS